MATSTVPDAIASPETTDQISPLASWFQTLATSLQAAFNKRQGYNYRWADLAARNGQLGMRKGDRGYQVDTDTEYRHNGTSWVTWNMPWRSYTPGLSGFTPGNGTLTSGYGVTNGIVHFEAVFIFGSTSAVTGGLPSFTIPLLPSTSGGGLFAGGLTSYILDAGNSYYHTMTVLSSSAAIIGVASGAGSITGLSAGVPMTWNSGDGLFVSATYKAG